MSVTVAVVVKTLTCSVWVSVQQSHLLQFVIYLRPTLTRPLQSSLSSLSLSVFPAILCLVPNSSVPLRPARSRNDFRIVYASCRVTGRRQASRLL